MMTNLGDSAFQLSCFVYTFYMFSNFGYARFLCIYKVVVWVTVAFRTILLKKHIANKAELL